MRIKILFIFLVIIYSSDLIAENAEWSAQWVMHPSVHPQQHAMILFRKEFDLKGKPEKFKIHVSADNHYRLFVNGKYITRGPARGDISHWFYETLDIAEYLRNGENLIAAEVINWGPKRSFTVVSQMTSFILQGDSDAEKMVNTYAGNWKCFQNKAFNAKMIDWMNDRQTIDFGLYVGNPTDSIVGSDYPWGWETLGFNASDWLAVQWCDVAGGRNEQFAGGILYPGGKLLIPRRVQLLKEQNTTFASIRRSSGMVVSDNFLHGKEYLIVPPNIKVSILIDQGVESMGYPELLVSGGNESRIQAMYSENLIVSQKSPKGNRDQIDGKYMVGIKDIFMPDGGENRTFKPSYIRAFRYIQLDIETKSSPLVVKKYYNVTCNAPLKLKASFKTDHSLPTWIMEAGWRTVSLCAQDYLLSDAYYEQLQYTGDARVHSLSLMTMSGDDQLTRNALIQFDQSRISDGLTYACYPSQWHLIIPSYSLIWIDQIYDYLMWKDDKEFIASFELGIKNVLYWFEQKLQPNGLIGKMEWWGALAWPKHYNDGEPPDIYVGSNTLYSLHFAYTLQHAAYIFEYLGKMEQSKRYLEMAASICESVNKFCRTEDGFYKESPQTNKVSQITNILAILADASTGQDAKNLMGKLLKPKDWFGQVDLFLHLYLFEAMNKTGYQKEFMSELSEWQLMKDRNMSGFAEVPLEWGEEEQRSECHPWSTSPNVFLFKTICGINPASVGHKVVEISPSFGNLTEIKALYPHYLGDIKMDLVKSATHIKGTIEIPAAMKATFIFNNKQLKLKNGSQIINFKSD